MVTDDSKSLCLSSITVGAGLRYLQSHSPSNKVQKKDTLAYHGDSGVTTGRGGGTSNIWNAPNTVGSRFVTVHFYDPCRVGPSTPNLWCTNVTTQASFLYLARF